VGDEKNTPIFTLHGGNGISPLNIRLFLPMLEKYCIISPDVIGMPGKSEPYRNLNTNREDFGMWLCELLDCMHIKKISFIVSSYSSAMMLSLAKISPNRIDKAVLIVPSGIAHGAIMPMMSKMALPFMKYYFAPSEKSLNGILDIMASEGDELWREFFDLMMSSYKMEMRAPKEYKKNELKSFYSPIIIFATNDDIFFPANKVFTKAEEIFIKKPETHFINGKHLPSSTTMLDVCKKSMVFLENI
jgi:pimeloyl-ACP methyl ester carboxylesterase